MTKARRNRPAKKVDVPARQNLKAAQQRRQTLRTHYAAKYRIR